MSDGLGLDDGTGGAPGADPRHDVLAALDAVRSGLEWLREAADRAWALSEEDLRESVAGGYQTLAVYQSTVLSLVKVLDERPEAVSGLSVSRPAASFLQQRLRLDPSRANADVRAAHALDPDDGELPEVGAAFAAGEITREHAVTCVRVLERLPRKLLILDVVDETTGQSASGMQVVDRVLAEFARQSQVRTVKQLVDQLVALLDPDRRERFDEDAHLRRSLRLTREDATGMGLLRMALTPAHTAMLAAALKAWSKPAPAADAEYTDDSGVVQTALVRDERTLGQRQYDAVMAAVLAGMTGDRTGLATLPRVDLSLLATIDQLAAAGLDMAALREQLADRHAGTGSGASPAADPSPAADAPAVHPPPATDARSTAEPRPTTDPGTAIGGSHLTDASTEASVTDASVTDASVTDASVTGAPSAMDAPLATGGAGGGGPSTAQQAAPTSGSSTAASSGAASSTPNAFRRNGSPSGSPGGSPDGRRPGLGLVGPGPGVPTLSGVGAVGRLLFGYLSCNAAVTRILLDGLGQPLDVGRTRRLATDSQRKALAVRDGGCGWPCCAVPFEGTAIHHFVEWQHGGPTDLINMGAFCERHHQMLHMGLGEAKVIDGHVHVRLATWMDPERRWLRNTAHRTTDTAVRLGQQLALTLDLDRRETTLLDRPEFDPQHWDRDRGSGPPDGAGASPGP